MKKNLLLACSILITLSTFNIKAQSVLQENEIDNYISKRSVEVYLEADFTGTPYKDKEFKNGTVLKNGTSIANNIGLRYNAAKDLFEVKKTSVLKDDQAKVLLSSKDISIKIGNEKFIFLTPSEKNTNQGYFLELLNGEKASLLKKIKKVYIPEQKAYTSLASNVAANYKEKTTLYIYNKNGELIELPNTKSKRIKAFGDNTKEIKTFVKENKININKDEGIIEVLNYYNSL